LDDNGTSPRRCQGITATGRRCEKLIGPSQTFCFSHNPEKAEERSALAAKAAKSKHITPCDEIVEIRQEMKSLAGLVRQKKVTVGVGSVVNQILGNMLRTFDQERRQKECDDLERRLAEVERMHARKRDTPTSDNPFDVGGGWVR